MTEQDITMFDDYIETLVEVVAAMRAKGVTKEQALKEITYSNDNYLIKSIDREIVKQVYAVPISGNRKGVRRND